MMSLKIDRSLALISKRKNITFYMPGFHQTFPVSEKLDFRLDVV